MRLEIKSRSPDQQSIAIEVQPEAVELARWIGDYFESKILAGTRFRDGEKVQLGWSLLLLCLVDGVLEVFEPDFFSMPIQWCRGVNNTIRHLYLQRAVCELFGCDPMFPMIRQAGIVSPGFPKSRSCTMFRDTPEASDSGWIFTEYGYGGAEGEYCSLYQLMLQKAEIVPFLALPPSSRIVIKPGFREIVVDGVTKSSADNEFLQRLCVQ